MDNMSTIVKRHKAKILKNPSEPNSDPGCNCPKRETCPLAGQCLTSSIVYNVTVFTNQNEEPKTYIGMTEASFKSIFGNHKLSLNNKNFSSNTALSKHVWDLKIVKAENKQHLIDGA